MMFRWLLVLTGGRSLACSSSHEVCTPPTSEVCPAVVPSFATEILPILNQRCNNCHSPGDRRWALAARHPGEREGLGALSPQGSQGMLDAPAGSPLMPVAERDKLWAWLICGAPDN